MEGVQAQSVVAGGNIALAPGVAMLLYATAIIAFPPSGFGLYPWLSRVLMTS
jgi:hypothetical protein